MKKLITIITIMLFSTITFGQTNFVWEKTDSISKTKFQIYSDTKMFIAETWKSAQSVIQNDDKDGGYILVKGLSIKNLYFQMNDHRYTFSYSVKFMMKEGKYKITIGGVYCETARCGIVDWPRPPAADKYPEEKGVRITGLSETNYLKLMKLLKDEMQGILDSYVIYISKTSTNNW